MYDYRSDPFVAETAAAVRAMYGERLANVLLYGSRARGDVHEESDYDFLVLLKEPFDYGDERKRLSDLSLKILLTSGQDVYFSPDGPNALEKRTLFMWNVRKEAVCV